MTSNEKNPPSSSPQKNDGMNAGKKKPAVTLILWGPRSDVSIEEFYEATKRAGRGESITEENEPPAEAPPLEHKDEST